MVNKKYELIDAPEGSPAPYRIRALRDLPRVLAGTVGGFVDSEYNLSHDGNCWIYDDAAALDKSRLQGDSKLFNNAVIRDYVILNDQASVEDNAVISGTSLIQGSSFIRGNAQIRNSQLRDHCEVRHQASLLRVAMSGQSIIEGRAEVTDATVKDSSFISDTSKIHGKGVVIGGTTQILGHSDIKGPVELTKFGHLLAPVEYTDAKIDGAQQKIQRKRPPVYQLDDKSRVAEADAGLEM